MEQLGAFFTGGYKKGYLRKIYLAEKIRQYLLGQYPFVRGVIVREKVLVITCADAASAYALNLQRSKIERQLRTVLGVTKLPYQLKIRSSD